MGRGAAEVKDCGWSHGEAEASVFSSRWQCPSADLGTLLNTLDRDPDGQTAPGHAALRLDATARASLRCITPGGDRRAGEGLHRVQEMLA